MNTPLNYDKAKTLADAWTTDRAGRREDRETAINEASMGFHLLDALDTLKEIARHLQFAYGDMTTAEKSIAEILHGAGIVDIEGRCGE